MSRLGIIAGGGSLPLKLMNAAQRSARDIFVLGIEGQTDRNLSVHAWTKLGATNTAISILKAAHVDQIVMAGHIRRPSLAEIKPDIRTLNVFMRLGTKAFGDDALLRAIVAELEKDGFKVLGAHDVDPGVLAPKGVLGAVQVNSFQKDVDSGITAARALGALDIGQAVVVQQGIILGVEAVEGTDALIDRCKALRRAGAGGVLVKCCKPQQDRRVDLPAIGLWTVRKVYEAGLAGIAVEAGASILLDREEVVAAADKLGIFILGF